jgi:hypothetical protein
MILEDYLAKMQRRKAFDLLIFFCSAVASLRDNFTEAEPAYSLRSRKHFHLLPDQLMQLQ